MSKALTDRSRILAYELCPRKRYLAYHYGGKGIAPKESPIALAVGLGVHAGLELLLRGEGADAAANSATVLFEGIVEQRGLALQPSSDLWFTYQEQRYLVEAMIYAYAQYGLPRLLAAYEVLEVEREELYDGFSPTVALMARADGLLRERATSDLHVLSFKTCSEYSPRLASEGRYDTQGLSEQLAINARLASEQTVAVKMEYLIKGKRGEYPKGSKREYQFSPLVHPYMAMGAARTSFAWSYDYIDNAGKARRLSSEYQRCNMWEVMPASEWVGLLASGRVQPEAGECLPKQFASPAAYYRNAADLQEWHISASAQEDRVTDYAEFINNITNDPAMSAEANQWRVAQELAELFPKYRQSCLRYGDKHPCAFLEACHHGLDIEDALAAGIMQWREPHHAEEKRRESGESN